MCGIAGKIDFREAVDPDLLARMCDAMVHRGPDERGIFNEDGAALAVQRLAIIDVAGGQQPMFNENRSVAVVMNGEIYNFVELRRGLEARGHRFATRSDTEVLVHLYEDHGVDLCRHLRGMFAFALWDIERRRLVLARDRVGKKPLFWARDGHRIWFASELRSLLQDPRLSTDINPRAIAAYLALQYVPHPLSVLDSVRKLPPATCAIIDDKEEELREYWRLTYSEELDGTPKRELEERLLEHLREAVRIRLMSEVPLGAFLSGGVDSSAVVALMAEASSDPVKTFSIGFPVAEYDELAYAREIATRFGTEHHEFVLEPRALEIMPKLARHYGEPFADPSAIPCFYLAELTRRHVTVALNGDGGDENFAGYRRYVQLGWVNRLAALPPPVNEVLAVVAPRLARGAAPLSIRARAARVSRIAARPVAERYAAAMSAFDIDRRRAACQPDFLRQTEGWGVERALTEPWERGGDGPVLSNMLAADVGSYLPDDLLVKMDIATMASSVEARSPFLDHHLMEFAAKLPAPLKLARGRGKVLLVSALRGLLPDSVLHRNKMGFGVPLARWFREELRDLPRDLLLDHSSRVTDYVSPSAIEQMIREHTTGDADHSLRLWVLLQLEHWHREVLSQAAPRPSSERPVARFGAPDAFRRPGLRSGGRD
jgi:asparagine synthase (glutamine-hydrolysing)